jgi:predicted dehydrogenase
MWSPRVEPSEALTTEAEYFLDCIESGQKPFNDGASGLRIVRLLEAADTSIRSRGEAVMV